MSKLKKAEIGSLVEKLEDMYPDAECALDFQNIFQLLIAVVLSAQTTDKSVNLVTPTLFERAKDPETLAVMETEELENLIRRIGMYRTKAANLKALAAILAKQYGGEVPDDYEKLTALPGVGRKTANVVLSVGFGHPRIAVDTHVFRLANRIGLTAETDVLKTEIALMKALPEAHWTKMHHALIFHGRQICSARKPKCEVCGIVSICKRNGLPPLTEQSGIERGKS